MKAPKHKDYWGWARDGRPVPTKHLQHPRLNMLLGVGGGVQTPALSLRAGLVSLWRFENSGALGTDTVGTNTLTNNNTATQGAGKLGSGLALASASSQYLGIASNATLQAGSGDVWLAFWIKAASASPFVVGKAGPGSSATEYSVVGASGKLGMRAGDAGSNVQANQTVNGLDGTWHFFMGWFNATTIRAYSRQDNGSIITSASGITGMQSASNPFNIGARGDAALFFNGSIDEVCFGKCAAGTLGNGGAGTLANEISTTLYNGGAGTAWPW